MERSEASKRKENQRPRQLTHRESQLRINPTGQEETHGKKKKISLLRELYCVCSGSKEPHCAKGLPHLLGLSRMTSFSSVWVQQTSCFLSPRPVSPFCTGQWGQWGLPATVAARRALARRYLVNTTALIISCFTSLLGFFPSALRKRSCTSLCPQIQMLLFCGGLV